MDTWSRLPIDVLDNIIRKLDLPVDAVSFSAVCKPWRHVALGMHTSLYRNLPVHHFLPKKTPLPMLLHPGCKRPNTHCLYSLNERKVYRGFHLPELSNKWIVGCGAGWLVTVDTVDPEVTLLNSLTGKKIPLPHLSTVPGCDFLNLDDKDRTFEYLRKVIVCSYHGSVLLVALVSQFKAICFCKVGDAQWTRLKDSPFNVDDIIMHNGKLYAVTWHSVLFEIDIADPVKVTMVPMQRDSYFSGGKRFLVNLCDELVLLERLTSRFNVFKLVEDEFECCGVYSWVPLQNLGHLMVFIGYNHSVALDSRVYPRCKGNCIYFADNMHDENDYPETRGVDKELYHNAGIYHLAEQKVKPFKHSSKASSPVNMVWLSPNLSSELEIEMLPQ